MTSIPVEQLTFTFDPSVDPFQYDVAGGCIAGWPHGSKVVGVVSFFISNHTQRQGSMQL